MKFILIYNTYFAVDRIVALEPKAIHDGAFWRATIVVHTVNGEINVDLENAADTGRNSAKSSAKARLLYFVNEFNKQNDLESD